MIPRERFEVCSKNEVPETNQENGIAAEAAWDLGTSPPQFLRGPRFVPSLPGGEVWAETSLAFLGRIS